MAVKIEKAGVGFGISEQGRSVIIEVRPHHDTIANLKGVKLGFELLNGISLAQAKKIADVLNENIVGVFMASGTDDKTQAASG
jgi:hypothetical protein